MTIKAIFWNTDSLYRDDEERALLKQAVKILAANAFNQVALSNRPAAEFDAALKATGIDNHLVYKMDGDLAAARTQDRNIGSAALTEALSGLNLRRVMAKAATLAPSEVLVISNDRESARAATKAGMTALCIEGKFTDTSFTDFVSFLGKPEPRL